MDVASLAARDVSAEHLRILYRSAPAACGVNVVLGLLVLAVVDEGRISRAGLIWYALVLLAAGLRFALWFWFRRASLPADRGCWSRRFTLGMLASGLAWGAGAFVLSRRVCLT